MSKYRYYSQRSCISCVSSVRRHTVRFVYVSPGCWPSESVCVLCEGPARSRMDSQAGWWLSLVMQADSLMTVLTPEHTSQWAPGKLAGCTHTVWHVHICVIYGVAFSEKDTGADENERERNLCVCVTLEKITGGAGNDKQASLYSVKKKFWACCSAHLHPSSHIFKQV